MLEMAGGQIGWGWYVVSHPLAGREWSWERSLLTASQRYSVQRAVTVAAVKCLSVFISGAAVQSPMNWVAWRAEAYHLAALEAGSLKLRCGQRRFLLRAAGEPVPCHSPSFWLACWPSLAHSRIPWPSHDPLLVSLHFVLLLCTSASVSKFLL